MASNQLQVAEKAKIISDEMGIPFEKVREIQRKEVKDCTIEELKIRYNNPNLGKFPEWFDFNKVDGIIWKIVHSNWSPCLSPMYDKYDLHSECWEKVFLVSKQIIDVGKDDYIKYTCKVVKLHISNLKYYTGAHKKYFVNVKMDQSIVDEVLKRESFKSRLPDVYTYHDILRDKEESPLTEKVVVNGVEKSRYICGEIKDCYVTEKTTQQEITDRCTVTDNKFEEMDMIFTVSTIQDTMLRDLISITAYLVAGLDYFEGLYLEAVHRLTEEKQFEIESYREKENFKRLTFKKVLKLVAGELSDRYLKKVTDYMQCFVKQNSIVNI